MTTSEDVTYLATLQAALQRYYRLRLNAQSKGNARMMRRYTSQIENHQRLIDGHVRDMQRNKG